MPFVPVTIVEEDEDDYEPRRQDKKVTNDIRGSWYVVVDGCSEYYTFNYDGTFEIESRNSIVSGTYSFSGTVNEGSSHSLGITVSSMDGSNTCYGRESLYKGERLGFRVKFLSKTLIEFDESLFSSSSIRLSPNSSFTYSGFSSSVGYGDIISFRVSCGELSVCGKEVKLISGPSGMEMAPNGYVQWVAEPIMFGSIQEVYFEVGFGDGSKGEKRSITVTKNNGTLPLARSLINPASHKGNIQMGDFTGNGIDELLVVTRENLISLFSYRDHEYTQIWLYPFSLPDRGIIVKALFVGLEGEVNKKIAIATNNTISVVSGEAAVSKPVYTSEGRIIDFIYSDINNDGVGDYVVVENGSGVSRDIVWLDSLTFEKKNTISVDERSGRIKEVFIGNFDDDENKEILSTEGIVYDLVDGVVDFDFSDYSGKEYVISSSDGDLDQIFFFTRTSKELSLLNMDGAVLPVISLSDGEQLREVISSDIDGDNIDELIVIFNEERKSGIYKKTLNGLSLWKDFNDVSYGMSGVSSGDIDGDGDVEVSFLGQFGGELITLDQINSENVLSYKQNFDSVDESYAAGWANITPDKSSTLFVTPVMDVRNQGFVTLNNDGLFSVDIDLEKNHDRDAKDSMIVDYDNDGFDEIFVSVARSFYRKMLSVRNLNSNTPLWEYFYDDREHITSIDSIDFNRDGYIDAVVAGNAGVRVLDIYNKTETDLLGGGQYMRYDVATWGNDSLNRLAVGQNTQLSFYDIDDNGKLNGKHSMPYSCKLMRFSKESGNLYCVNGHQIHIIDPNYTVVSSIEMSFSMHDLLVVEGTNNAIVSTYKDLSLEFFLVELDVFSGETIWQSPERFPGRIEKRTLHWTDDKQLTFSAGQVMYMTR